MLSFYEFDCLLRKVKKGQKRLDEMAFGQNAKKSLTDIASLLAQHLDKQNGGAAPAAAPAAAAAPPAAQKPVSIEPATPEAPLAAAAPAGKPKPKTGGATRKAAVGGGAAPTTAAAAIKPNLPAKVNTTPDPNDPDSAAAQERKAKFGREKTSLTRELKGNSEIDKWNVMMKSGGNIMGHDVSTWAWAMKHALQELGVKLPPEIVGKAGDRNDPKHGVRFQIVFAPGQSKQDQLPEVLVKPNTFKHAVKKAYELVGTPEDENAQEEPERMVDFDRKIKAGGHTAEFDDQGNVVSATKKSGMESVVQQASMFSKVIFNDKFTSEVAGKPMTVKQIAHKLNQIAPLKTDADIRQDAALSPHGVEGDVKRYGDQHDLQNAIEALIYMIEIDQDNNYGFFQVKSPQLNADSVVLIIPPSEMRQGVDDLSTPVAAGGGTAGGPQRSARDLSKAYRAKMTRQAKKGSPPAAPAGDAIPQAESAGWMDVYELMEHWSF